MARVAIIGAGAVGAYYGARLARAGHDVRFLFRRDLAAVRARGLDIRSWQGDFHLDHVQAFASPQEIGRCDWVICSLKATAVDEARVLVEPCLAPEGRVVALMNGLGVEDRFADWLGPERVLGGMAFVCINRGEPGTVHHLDYGRVTIGSACDDAAATEDLRALLSSGGVETVVAPNLLYARWEKLCWNIPFNGLSVAAGGVGTQTILANDVLAATAERAMREVAGAGNADLAATGSDVRLDVDAVVEAMFAQTRTMGDYRTSMVIDYVLGRPLEVDAILGEPARRAVALGVPSGTMTALHAAVWAADQRRQGVLRCLTPADLEAGRQ